MQHFFDSRSLFAVVLIPEAIHEALHYTLWFSLLVRKTELVVSQVAIIIG